MLFNWVFNFLLFLKTYMLPPTLDNTEKKKKKIFTITMGFPIGRIIISTMFQKYQHNHDAI